MDNTAAKNQFQMVTCVINAGFSEAVMTAARKAGAQGATIIRGRGTASREAERVFSLSIQPEKEIVMILVPTRIKDDVMRAIYDSVGLDDEGQGIVFSLPVERSIGLREEEPGQTPAEK